MKARTKAQQRAVNIICAAALIAGIWLTSVDGIMRYFNGTQGTQYLFNFVLSALFCPPASVCLTSQKGRTLNISPLTSYGKKAS